MCGIIGYVGAREVPALLIDGLKRLEYRGYDSCGIAVLDNGTPKVVRAAGRVGGLEQKVQQQHFLNGGVHCGIGHTRWATHGRPTETNAHPHQDCSGRFLVVHNGIIENYLELRQRLKDTGHAFRTETDTEVIPHLIESHYRGNLEEAVLAALREIEGVYALVVLSSFDSPKLVAARRGPPLVIGYGAEENFVASDAASLLPHTREMVFLGDGELAVVRSDSVDIRSLDGERVSRPRELVSWSAERVEKEGFPHFMLKEIFEQPRAIRDTLRGRLDEEGNPVLERELGQVEALAAADRIHIVACGTSLHAGLVGRFLIETLAGVPVDVEYASEFRYRQPLLGRKSVVLAISQSGETADTLAALSEGRQKGASTMSICNVVGSTMARQSDCVLYTHAGPEIGVASTKAFTTQLAALNLLALFLARLRGSLPAEEIRWRARLLQQIPEQIGAILDANGQIVSLAERLFSYRNFLYLGRGLCYPIALEGALKLKEISYIHAEGYPAGEMKHGPIALIDAEMPVVVVAPRDGVYVKTRGNIEEVKGRGAIVVALATQGDSELSSRVDHTLFLPTADPTLAPLLATVPLQLLAYHIAVLRGCDVDKPRNLAKSVTVE